MLPYKTLLAIDRTQEMPVYLQIVKGLIDEISNGRIAPGARLPSSRKMSDLLDVHRKTVVAAYAELEAQGWIESRSTAGTFINDQLPIRRPISLTSTRPLSQEKTWAQAPRPHYRYQFDDGAPDIRLAPLDALAREYSSLLRNRHFIRYLNYSEELKGDPKLRQALAEHFRDTRGINVSIDHILVTRGSVMAFYLYLTHFLRPGERVIAGEPGYGTFNQIVSLHEGTLVPMPVDDQGLDIDRLEKYCSTHPVELVYIVSHHHHPTTVTLSPERRLRLLQLAETFDFMILEDDYDYDFHYNSSPVLPLASLPHGGRVIYVGSFSKSVAPGLRTGFLVGRPEIVEQLAERRRFIDRMGDFTLERAVSHLLVSGEIRRHLNKCLQAYRKRRDLLCNLLDTHLADVVSFRKPEGGMAVWAKFAKHIDLSQLAQKTGKQGLYISAPQKYNTVDQQHIRLGFAAMNELEIEQGFKILHENIRQWY